ncbi:MAG: ATP-grasp domain-containing protein [Clostridiales bacterium]|jgi:acetyl-CoA carboxylase biotin carboxylase subunit|nr:ATP-grasp domain-containing protein [Clostridiales bacterium]
MFSKILIANRGEIAVRIIRACKEMGILTVAVVSEADKAALHAALADECICIGSSSSADSYLRMDRIVSAALLTGAQAIHPGYGFLSENSEFAALCRKNGIAFIGPSAENMQQLSNKTEIKRRMSEAGLSCIPGTPPLKSLAEAEKNAEEIGYPVMLKAANGGGGRGIRLVNSREELSDAYSSSVAEAIAAFGSGAVYMEKYIWPAKHVEIQIIADETGRCVVLGDRDCSIQKRHQKIIEETTAPTVSAEKRAEMIDKCAAAIKKIGYFGVGTLEFLLDESGNFWFMEMNVRLQVEHAVTEMLTQTDLVKWQIRVAAGIPLSFTQRDIDMNGSAIECRINALRPGRVSFIHVPSGPFVRFDTYLTGGAEVTRFYDPMVGKMIVYAGTREEAIRKMKASLCELVISGVDINIEELLSILEDERFASGRYDLSFFD